MKIVEEVENTKNYKEFRTVKNPLNYSLPDFKDDIKEPPILN